jgi:hypothetical protein
MDALISRYGILEKVDRAASSTRRNFREKLDQDQK